MNLFSERYGYSPRSSLFQVESMDDCLRNSLYNVLYDFLFLDIPAKWDSYLCRLIYTECWLYPADTLPNTAFDFGEVLKKQILELEWYEVYDLIEFIYQKLDKGKSPRRGESIFTVTVRTGDTPLDSSYFSSKINKALQREHSGYRLFNGCITPITNELAIAAIRTSLSASDRYSGVRMHIESALSHFAERPNPDFRNTVKEAILAVEAAAKVYTGKDKATLGEALKEMRKRDAVHPALLEGWMKIYGFTSDEQGIRHASTTGGVTIGYSLAQYMLVSCSAFANYIISLDSQS